MDKQKYLNILNSDINRFITYLIDDNLHDLEDADKVTSYIPDSFPYLSTLHLIHSNYDSNEANSFVKKYETILSNETKQLRLLLGYFLCDCKELESLQHQLELLQRDNEEKVAKIQLLNDEVITLKGQKDSLETVIIFLNQEKKRLVEKITELELKLKESAFEHHPPKDPNIDSTTNAIPSDLIDMGTSVLRRSCNLGSRKAYEKGDCFSWGAWNSDDWFESDNIGYKRVIENNISGLPDYDVARSMLGERYRIPTAQEWKELLEICTITNCNNYVKLISSKTNNQLILPIFGHFESGVLRDKDIAQYWTSEQYNGKSSYICQIIGINWAVRYAPKWCGLPIRPVFDPQTQTFDRDKVDKVAELANSVRTNVLRKLLGIYSDPDSPSLFK